MSAPAQLFWTVALLIGIGYVAGYITARLRDEVRRDAARRAQISVNLQRTFHERVFGGER
jgi:hypothetical protein